MIWDSEKCEIRSEEVPEAKGYIEWEDKGEDFIRGQCKTKDPWTSVLQDKKTEILVL